MSAVNTAAIDRIVNASLKAWKVPGVAVAIVSGDEVYLQGYGIRELGGSDPVTPDTLFAIASVSKAFTTTAMAMLVEEGKLDWEDHPRKHIPFFKLSDPVADSAITVRDLVCHRTGMPRHDWLWYGSSWDRAEIVRRYCLAKPAYSFRGKYEYANVPFMAAGLVVGAASGGTWEDFARSRIFEPLGMETANFSAEVSQASPNHCSPHEKFKGKMTVVPWCKMEEICPGGGISASARDMSKWIRFHLANGEFEGNRLIAEEKLMETRKPQVVVPNENPDKYGFDSGMNIAAYCLGWQVHDYRGRIVTDHGGYIDGFTSRLSLVPSEKLGIMVLANTTDGPIAQSLSRSLLDELLGLPFIDWTARHKAQAKAQKEEAKAKKAEEQEKGPKRHPRTKPSRELAAYAGDYEDPAYGTLKIAAPDHALHLSYNMISDIKLTHYHFDTFTAKFEEPGINAKVKLAFTLDADGEVASVNVVDPVQAEFAKVAPLRQT